MDGALGLANAARLTLLAWLLVMLLDVDALDEKLLGLRHGLDHHALGAAVLAPQHDHPVAFTDLHFGGRFGLLRA